MFQHYFQVEPSIPPVFPGAEQLGIFKELGFSLYLLYQIGSDEDEVIMQFMYKDQGLCSNYGMNTTNFIADFPANFKQIIRE
jgi:hypothetical protein